MDNFLTGVIQCTYHQENLHARKSIYPQEVKWSHFEICSSEPQCPSAPVPIHSLGFQLCLLALPEVKINDPFLFQSFSVWFFCNLSWAKCRKENDTFVKSHFCACLLPWMEENFVTKSLRSTEHSFTILYFAILIGIIFISSYKIITLQMHYVPKK